MNATDGDNASEDQHDLPSGTHPDELVEQLRHAAALTGQLLKLLGIARVIDVDDSWRDETYHDLGLVIAAITTGRLRLADLLAKEATRSLVIDSDGELRDIEDVVDGLRREGPNLPEQAVGELTAAARIAQPGDWPVPPEGKEHFPGVVNATDRTDMQTLLRLRDLIEPNADFLPLTLEAWNAERDALLADQTPTLVLLDRDFSREGGAEDEGERLLATLLQRTDLQHVAFGLLTHKVSTPAQEQQLAAEISDHHRAGPGRVVVLAKSRITDEPTHLPNGLRVALLSRELQHVREHVSDALDRANTVASEAIQALDPWTTMAVLEAARHEGDHEPNGIVRVAQTASRRRLAQEIRSSAIMDGPLPRLRQAMDLHLFPTGLSRPAEQWRRLRDDRYDDADYLAALRMPLEAGDIFQLHDAHKVANNQSEGGKSQYFILLVQPCDAIVRPNGKRAYNPTTMVVAHMRKARPSEGGLVAKDNEVLLEHFDPDDGATWVAQLANRAHLPAKALDACVFHPEGLGRIEIGESVPFVVSPPWARRHEKLQEWAVKVIGTLRRLESEGQSLGDEVRGHIIKSLTGATPELHGVNAHIEPTADILSYGLRRVARLTDPNARALLTLASHHQDRPAQPGRLLTDIDDPPQ